MISISENKCTGCGLCVRDCFPGKIEVVAKKAKYTGPCMECGHCVAVCPRGAVSMDNYNMDEVLEYEEGKFELDGDNYLNSLKFRRTVRQFTNREVTEEQINKIIEAGRYSPTGGNQQNVSYVVLRNNLDKLKLMVLEELNNLANDQNNPLSKTPYALMWKRMYSDYTGPEKKDGLFFNSGTVILVLSESMQNGSIAASNMETMINALGLGMVFSGFFQMAAARSTEISEYLGLKPGQQVCATLVIGEPKVKFKRTVPRRPAKVLWK